MNQPYLQSILDKKVLFFSGKGGVGKSALTSATALLCQRYGKKVFLVSWNPFDAPSRSLPYEALGIKQFVLDGPTCFKEYAVGILKFEKLYDLVFENNIFQTFISVSPGLTETVIAGKIWDLTDKHPEALVLVDLPSSGHAYTFFSSPLGLRKLFRLGLVHRELERICEMFLSPTTLLNFVTLPEELPISETLEFKKKLSSLGPFHFGFTFLNQCLPAFSGKVPQEMLSGPSLNLFNQYQLLTKQEKEASDILQTTGMSPIKIPRLTCPEWITTVEAISEELDKQ